MSITVGMMVLVQQYGDTPAWFEVVSVTPHTVMCTNGFGDHFRVRRSDITDVSATGEGVV